MLILIKKFPFSAIDNEKTKRQNCERKPKTDKKKEKSESENVKMLHLFSTFFILKL